MMTPELRVAGWLFLLGAGLLWLGWVLLPAQPGTFFVPHVFGEIRPRPGVVPAVALVHAGVLPPWLLWATALLGIAPIALTMARPDELERYRPIFHLNAAWLSVLGAVLLAASHGTG